MPETHLPSSQSGLPISLSDLINARSVEHHRIEFKAGWDEYTKDATVRTISAFANDLLNLNGGYVIIGIETDDQGHPVLPPRGLDSTNVDRVQREIFGQCNRITPNYQPLFFPELFQSEQILVIWAPGGDNRPYQAPSRTRGGTLEYYVRQGSETVMARGALLTQLLEQAATVPFDDRRSLVADLDAISGKLVTEFLRDIESEITRDPTYTFDEICSKMRLTYAVNDHHVPRNFALLFFSDDPDQFFPGSRVEIVQFSDDAGGNLIEERTIRGPIHHQIRLTLSYLNSLADAIFRKVPGQAEIERTVTYPYEAIEEAVVNAVYHRSYQNSEPTKVYLYPDRLEIISYPGPVQGIERSHLVSGGSVPPVPARNRKIGEFLKELRLAEARGTGLPKIRRRMSESGSPEPQFDFDDGRSYFRVVLPAHPTFRAIHALRESALMWALGERSNAIRHLQRAAVDQPGSGTIVGQIIEYASANDDLDLAKDTFQSFTDADIMKAEVPQPFLRYALAMLNRGNGEEAIKTLSRIPPSSGYGHLLEAAILNKRAENFEEAHRIFDNIYPQAGNDSRMVHEFAQTKLALARRLNPIEPAKRTLNEQVAELLRRAIQLTDDPVRKAWCWFELAGTLDWLRAPRSEIEDAFQQAILLRPQEAVFSRGYERWRSRSSRGRTRFRDSRERR